MSKYDEDFPRARDVAGNGIKYGLAFVAIVIVLSAAAWVWHVATAPVRMAGNIVTEVFDAQHALQTYRWFHEANQQIKAKKAQIMLSKAALTASSEDRKEARRVELLGLQQGCQSLVSEYNAKATRADTVIFQHPERFLPGDWPGDRSPLPQAIELETCN
jgi:hypothetical protein